MTRFLQDVHDQPSGLRGMLRYYRDEGRGRLVAQHPSNEG